MTQVCKYIYMPITAFNKKKIKIINLYFNFFFMGYKWTFNSATKQKQNHIYTNESGQWFMSAISGRLWRPGQS